MKIQLYLEIDLLLCQLSGLVIELWFNRNVNGEIRAYLVVVRCEGVIWCLKREGIASEASVLQRSGLTTSGFMDGIGKIIIACHNSLRHDGS